MTPTHSTRRFAPARGFIRSSAWAVAAAGLQLATGAHAQSSQPIVLSSPVPANVVQISAAGSIEVPQDYLTITLAATREAPDAATVQTQLKTALDAALAQARGAVQGDQLEVQTGAFSLSPRYDRNGKISTWQGRSELVIQGRDFGRISTLAGQIQGLAIADVAFSLSRDGRQKVEQQVQGQAIERFKAKAGDVAKGFGFSQYSLREISVNTEGDGGYVPRPRMMAMAASAKMEDAAVPVEAGKATVTVTVSGSIQLQ